MTDYSLEDATGIIRAHTPDCPVVRGLADFGNAVITLLDCQVPLVEGDGDIVFHDCLKTSAEK